MSTPRRGLRARSGEMMSQKPLHTIIIKSAIDNFHALFLDCRLTTNSTTKPAINDTRSISERIGWLSFAAAG